MTIAKDEFVSRYDGMILSPLMRDYFGEKDFFNLGYWLSETQNMQEACETLMSTLLDFIPNKEGRILDVACGLGATTDYLLKYYSPENVIGINISEKQLEVCRTNIPDCTFILMDAVQIEFENESFENIICVEAAFHFNTRKQFLQEAYRILKPGGYLVLADLLFKDVLLADEWMIPKSNELQDVETYKDLFIKSGFFNLKTMDITEQSWREFHRKLKLWLLNKHQTEGLDDLTYSQIDSIDDRLNANNNYLLVSAQKPDMNH